MASSNASPPPRIPTLHDVGCQVHRDLFGKDVQDTPTASYSWVADQMGHFALGFEITFALSWIFVLLGWDHLPTILLVPASILIGFSLKELSDYITAKTKATQSHSDFPFDKAELFRNMGTAVLYIGLGVVIAGPAVVLANRWATEPGLAWVPLLLLIPVGIIAAWLGVWWLKRKITFQQAGLPMMYRLAIFPNYLGQGADLKANVDFIDELIDPTKPSGRHLVIAGPPLAGKSSLATGVGTEFAFNMGIGRYTTLIRLLESEPVKNPQSDAPTEFQDGRILWPWETSDLLVVDDVDYVSGYSKRVERHALARAAARAAAADGGHHHAAVATAEPVASEADSIAQIEAALRERLEPDFLKGLAQRRSVWVVGDGSDAVAADWLAMVQRLLGLTGTPDAVRLVHLKMTIPQALKAKGAPIESMKNPTWLLRNMK
jgi:hypothetical protein